MYKVIIDGEIVFSTDDRWEFVEYCISHHMIHMLASELLPDEGFMMKLGTAQPEPPDPLPICQLC